MVNNQERILESLEIIDGFESVEMAEYELMISASASEPYWQRVIQAITDYKEFHNGS
ncbi:hypothetical protein [Acinetobacter ursingii]|uniref:hypothetical protein n=1 Tax=Acinetobacter ursingii TaxID=108980 RepID=UPI0021CD6D5B|nr:hypothetical protein [Acinetobacter ursingii]MCU4601870.1 hypothetical protein [Acinetobacter ursingii]